MKYLDKSFSVAVDLRDASIWRTCPFCERDCLGDDGLRRHLAEKHFSEASDA